MPQRNGNCYRSLGCFFVWKEMGSQIVHLILNNMSGIFVACSTVEWWTKIERKRIKIGWVGMAFPERRSEWQKFR